MCACDFTHRFFCLPLSLLKSHCLGFQNTTEKMIQGFLCACVSARVRVSASVGLFFGPLFLSAARPLIETHARTHARARAQARTRTHLLCQTGGTWLRSTAVKPSVPSPSPLLFLFSLEEESFSQLSLSSECSSLLWQKLSGGAP